MTRRGVFLTVAIACVCVVLVGMQATAAPIINWGWAGGDGGGIGPDPTIGVSNPGSVGWLVQMYQSNHGSGLGGITFDITGAAGGTGAGDTLAGYSAYVAGDEFYTTFSVAGLEGAPVAGGNVYSVLFNGPSVAAATQAIILDTTAAAVPVSGVMPYSVGTLGAGGSWQPIPEPCTLALLALGAITVGIRRRFGK